MRHHPTTKLFDYYFCSDDQTVIIGEKLCRSHEHAEKMRRRYEEKYGKKISASFFKIVIIRDGKVIKGF